MDLKRSRGGAVELSGGFEAGTGDLFGAFAAIVGGLHGSEGEVATRAGGPELVKLLRGAVGVEGEDAVGVRGEAVELGGLVFFAFVRHGRHEVLGLQPGVSMAEGLEDHLTGGEVARAIGIGEVAVEHDEAGRGTSEADEGIADLGDLRFVHNMPGFLPQRAEAAQSVRPDAGDAVFLGDNDGGHEAGRTKVEGRMRLSGLCRSSRRIRRRSISRRSGRGRLRGGIER